MPSAVWRMRRERPAALLLPFPASLAFALRKSASDLRAKGAVTHAEIIIATTPP